MSSMLPTINIVSYNYPLPDAKIAKYPIANRDESKLLISAPSGITEVKFRDIASHLPADSLLVLNNTRVIHARLFFKKETGASIEIFCLEPVFPEEYQEMFSVTQRCIWKCLVGNLKKWKDKMLEKTICIGNTTLTFSAEILQREEKHVLILFQWNAPVSFGALIEQEGLIPIPPYLDRETEAIDNERYQTIYSNIEGSVAAPTAGLHFTDQVFCEIEKKGIKTASLSLHVGAGTFIPVKTPNIREHLMHREHVSFSKHFLEALLASRTIVAVGTTSVRTLESIYFLGCRAFRNEEVSSIFQWEPYENKNTLSRHQAIESLINYMEKNKLQEFSTTTSIMIIPSYRFMMTDILITNFHQPQSSLLLLVSAFIGERWKEVYQYALENNFRFLSYGDSSLLFP